MRRTQIAVCLLLGACTPPSGSANATAPAEQGILRLSAPRAAHAAVALPDGDALLIGGCVADSCETGADSQTVDRFDLAGGRLTRAGTLAAPRTTMAAAVLRDGRVLIAGGWVGPAVSDSVELFDPNTGRSRALAPLAVPRADIARAVLPDGRVLLAGGYRDGRAQDVIEVYDPASERTRVIGRLGVPRAGAATAVLTDGRVLIVGGAVTGGQRLAPSAAVEIVDPRDSVVRSVGALTTARYKHAALTLRDGSVLVVGGSDARDCGGKLRSVERFDPRTGRFAPAGRLRDARYKLGDAVVLLGDGRVLVAGGADHAEIYDPATGRSQYAGLRIGEALNFSTATLLGDGSVLIAGGYSEHGIHVRDHAWRFDPGGA